MPCASCAGRCGERLQAQGDSAGALEQFAALFCLTPGGRARSSSRLRRAGRAPPAIPAGLVRALCGRGRGLPAGPIARLELLVGMRPRCSIDSSANRAEAVDLCWNRRWLTRRHRPSSGCRLLRRLEELYGRARQRSRAACTRWSGWPRWSPALPSSGWCGRGRRSARPSWARPTGRWPPGRRACCGIPRDRRGAGGVRAAAGRGRALAGSDRAAAKARGQPARPPTRSAPTWCQIATLVARSGWPICPRAIETWREVEQALRRGRRDCVDALAELYAAAGRFDDRGRAAGPQRWPTIADRHADMLARLGDTLRERLAQPEPAIDCYARALEVDPAQAAARAGSVRAAGRTRHWAAAARAAGPRGGAHRCLGAAARLASATVWPASAEPARRVRLLQEAAALAETARRGSRPGRSSGCARRCRWRRTTCALQPRAAAPGGGHREASPPAAQALGEAIAAGPGRAAGAGAAGRGARAACWSSASMIWPPRATSYAAGLALAPQRLELRLRA